MAMPITGRCPFCKASTKFEDHGGFRDPQSLAEYRISGLCQKCQDEFFGKPGDPRCEGCDTPCGSVFLHTVIGETGELETVCPDCCLVPDCPHTCEDGCQLSTDHTGLCEVKE